MNHVDGNGVITATTDRSGNIYLAFTAPVFSGMIRITASSTIEKASGSDTVIVKVPDLVAFSGSGRYSPTGAKNWHPDNHYLGSENAILSLVGAADSFAVEKWNNTGGMRLNDMSLPWGGVLDIDTDWTYPHSLHRVGKSVDIENIAIKDTTVTFTINKEKATRRVPVGESDRLTRFVNFMLLKKWFFQDEHQTTPDSLGRVKWPHFEWKGN